MFYLIHFFCSVKMIPVLKLKMNQRRGVSQSTRRYQYQIFLHLLLITIKCYYQSELALFQTPLSVSQLAQFFSARREPAEYQGKEGSSICSCRQIVLKLSA